MKVTLELDSKMHIIGDDSKEHKTHFDSPAMEGDFNHATPMSVMLQSMAACSFMDTISIIRKKRKDDSNLKVEVEAERADEHPKVFTKVHLKYILTSKDAEKKDIDRAVELSQEKYCAASAMFKAAGCEVTFETDIKRP